MAEIGNVTVRVDAVITDEQYREAMGAVSSANERIDLLEDKNAKLRELVQILAYCTNENAECDKCIVNGGDSSYVRQVFCDTMAERLRELGTEVES